MASKHFFTKKQAATLLLFSLLILALLQVGVMAGFVPSNWFWGGRVAGVLSYLTIIAVAILAYAAWVVAIAGGFIRVGRTKAQPRYVGISLWFFTIYLFINTLVNVLTAITFVERYVMSGFALILAFLFLRLAVSNK